MYRVITTSAEVRDYLGETSIFSFDFETAPDAKYRDDDKASLDPHKAHIVGISFSVSEGSGIYVPLNHGTGVIVRIYPNYGNISQGCLPIKPLKNWRIT